MEIDGTGTNGTVSDSTLDPSNKDAAKEIVSDSTLNPSNNDAAKGKKTNLKRRLKRMLNPFFVTTVPSIDYSLFTHSLPMHLDIGCAKGAYIQSMRTYNDQCIQSMKLAQEQETLRISLFLPKDPVYDLDSCIELMLANQEMQRECIALMLDEQCEQNQLIDSMISDRDSQYTCFMILTKDDFYLEMFVDMGMYLALSIQRLQEECIESMNKGQMFVTKCMGNLKEGKNFQDKCIQAMRKQGHVHDGCIDAMVQSKEQHLKCFQLMVEGQFYEEKCFDWISEAEKYQDINIQFMNQWKEQPVDSRQWNQSFVRAQESQDKCIHSMFLAQKYQEKCIKCMFQGQEYQEKCIQHLMQGKNVDIQPVDILQWNYLGIELYGALVNAANESESKRKGDVNLLYVAANINLSLASLNIPNIRRVTLLFPGIYLLI